MIRFIRFFMMGWKDYPQYISFYTSLKERKPLEVKRMEESDMRRGIKPYRGRLDFAFRHAKIYMKHRRG